MASNKFLEETGLSRLWAHTKQLVAENQVSARNLLTNSDFSQGSYRWESLPSSITTDDTTGYKYVSIGYGWNFLKKQTVKANTTYTVSAMARNQDSTPGTYFRVNLPSGIVASGTLRQSLGATWQKVAITFTTADFSPLEQEVNFQILKDGNGQENKIDVALIKLEEGKLATPWTPAFEDITPSIVEFIDFQCMNGANNGDSGNTSYIRILNFPTFQLMNFDVWLNHIDLTGAWKSKQVISIPLKYLRFKNSTTIAGGAPEYFDSNAVADANLDAKTGIITASNRTVNVTNTRLKQVFLIYDSEVI